MAKPLTTTIPIRDRDGNIVSNQEVATYAGLLARAHEEELSEITTNLVQIPNDVNQQTAIVTATVTTVRGTFTGIGDANPRNVNRRLSGAVIRMAETRAKARALRDAVNIGVVALDELCETPSDAGRPSRGPDDNVRPLRSPSGGSTVTSQAPPPPMTDGQRRLLLRILFKHGYEGESALELLCQRAGVPTVEEITKARASELIDAWKEKQEASRAS